MNMNIPELRTLLDSIEATAREVFAEDGEVRPVTFVAATLYPEHYPNPDPNALPMIIIPWVTVGWDGTDRGGKILRGVQQDICRRAGAIAVVNLTEAWSVAKIEGQPNRAAQRPDKWEIILLWGECPEGAISRQIIITRDEHGKGTLGESDECVLDRAAALAEAEVSYFAGYFPPAGARGQS
jgi:hypothetical protein